MGGKVAVPDSIAEAFKKASIGILVMIGIFVFSGVAISYIKNMPVGEAISFALAFATHSGDEFMAAGLALKSIYLTLSFAVSVLIFYIFYILIDISISGKIGRHLHGVKRMNRMKKMKNHHIICGAGRVGKNVGKKLAEKKEKVVFIEKESDVINALRRKGHYVYETGPIDEEVLVAVGVEQAKSLTASLGDDGKNLLLVITARHLNPKLTIAARIMDAELISKFKHAGADLVIIPEAVGGIKLAEALLGRVDHAHVIKI